MLIHISGPSCVIIFYALVAIVVSIHQPNASRILQLQIGGDIRLCVRMIKILRKRVFRY